MKVQIKPKIKYKNADNIRVKISKENHDKLSDIRNARCYG